LLEKEGMAPPPDRTIWLTAAALAELRREHFVRRVPIKELVRRTGLSRNTIRVALRSEDRRCSGFRERPSKLDPFKDEIHRLLKDDPKLPR
jgi:hypothetical protein